MRRLSNSYNMTKCYKMRLQNDGQRIKEECLENDCHSILKVFILYEMNFHTLTLESIYSHSEIRWSSTSISISLTKGCSSVAGGASCLAAESSAGIP